jgi:hypothetical protein
VVCHVQTEIVNISMNIKPIDIIGSILLGLFAIYLLHRFMVVDSCLDLGGAIESESGVCIDAEGNELSMMLTAPLLCIYFVLGLVVSMASAFTIKKIRCAINR